MNTNSDSNNIPTPSIDLLQGMFNRTLIDLGKDGDQRLSGIYSPVYNNEEVGSFMSSYYESSEGVQSQLPKLDGMHDYYFALLSEAFAKINFFLKMQGRHLSILELGCGFGSATFPLLKLFPNADIIASEFSISMLHAMKNKLNEENLMQQCALLQLNAEDLDFKANSFDLVAGAAILHHLFQPEKTLSQCAKILRPGGVAIFFEPFENGYSIMGLLYKTILNDKRAKWFNRKFKNYFRHSVLTWQKMKILDKKDFTGIDDKWLFTRQYFNSIAEESGFERCTIHTLDKSHRPFEALVKTHLNGNGFHNVPHWIWEIVREYEDWFSDNMKDDLLTEGCVILQK